MMWITGDTPDDWKHSETVLLYKERGPTEHGPIALAPTIYKLWTRTITKSSRNMRKRTSY